MKKTFSAVLAMSLLVFSVSCAGRIGEISTDGPVNTIRPSAVPLITVDPYFSIWSTADELNSRPTTHWTGKEHPLVGAIRVDGEVYRVLGKPTQKYDVILPTIAQHGYRARYSINEQPRGKWMERDYNDSAWKEGPGAFGSNDEPGVRTGWGGDNTAIWVRRSFNLDKDMEEGCPVFLEYSHDDTFELFINGIQVVKTGYVWKKNVRVKLSPEVVATLKKGKNVIAAHCQNLVGGSYVDFGLSTLTDQKEFGKQASQLSCNVLPTKTIYTFDCGAVDLELIFSAPMLLNDLELVSRPVNYLTWQVRSKDGAEHDVQVYVEATPELAVNDQPVPVVSKSGCEDGISYVRTGTVDQKVLQRKGDNVRIDWGYFYLASPEGKGQLTVADYYGAKDAFMQSGTAAESAVPQGKSELRTDNFMRTPIALCYTRDLGKVGSDKVTDYVLLAYDDIYSIQYFQQALRPWWNSDGTNTVTREMKAAADGYSSILGKADAFDRQMMKDAENAGGRKYAELCALAYRQAIAAHKLVKAPNGELLFLSKENFSNGSIGTVDVTYPSEPLFLLYNTDIAKGLLNHIFYYSESGKWSKPFAAHDVGTYPMANGQTYGGDMPVEECGNMVILAGAICRIDKSAKYAKEHWNTLTQWTSYLIEYGQDPANQLCTDDFAGHFAHNTNLSVKAIIGVACYGMMADMLGMKDVAKEYTQKAREMAKIWKETAFDGDHYRLTFDKPGTWSQKYNMVWDKVLDLDIFDDDIMETEIPYYLTRQNRYGLPLDNRKAYTKTDWIMWTATMAEDKDTFEKFIDPVWDFFNETTDRIPMSDWIWTDQKEHRGFQARSVVGGYFIKMLDEKLND